MDEHRLKFEAAISEYKATGIVPKKQDINTDAHMDLYELYERIEMFIAKHSELSELELMVLKYASIQIYRDALTQMYMNDANRKLNADLNRTHKRFHNPK